MPCSTNIRSVRTESDASRIVQINILPCVSKEKISKKIGPVIPGPLAPKVRIIPLDQLATTEENSGKRQLYNPVMVYY